MTIDPKYKPILLEALEDMMYKLSMQLEPHKGKPLTGERKQLTAKQNAVEELQHMQLSKIIAAFSWKSGFST